MVGADGRHSVVRERAGLSIEEFGAPMDVLWFRLSRRAGDPVDPMGRFDRGRIFIMLNRGRLLAMRVRDRERLPQSHRVAGLVSFRESVAQLAPFAADRVQELHKLGADQAPHRASRSIEAVVRTGLLCIGDAAHAMSPVGGVGINLAIQDAVATANLLTAPLRAGRPTTQDLQRVQQRREWPTRMTQRVQLAIQDRVIRRALTDGDRFSPPFPIRLLALVPFLRRIPARMIGLGFRPEHVQTSDTKTLHASAADL